MANRTYFAHIISNTSEDRIYTISHRSAMKAAAQYGRCEQGESVTIRTFSGQTLSKVLWDSQSRKYINVTA